MIPADETFGGSWPFEACYSTARGFQHHYVDEGDAASGEVFVLLHGEPTWGYIWRHFVRPLAERGRVVVPDHMGFGKSETPTDRAWSVEEHCDNLEALLLELDLTGVTLVMQDWGGPIGTNFACRHSDRVQRLFYIDSFPRVGVPSGMDLAELARVGVTPWAEFFTSDDFEPVMSHLSRTILSVLKLVGFENHDVIDEEWIRAYAAPFPTAADAAGAIAFPRCTQDPATFAYFAAAMSDEVIAALRDKPAESVIGEMDRTLPHAVAEAMLREVWPDAPFSVLPGVGHYAQEDAPALLVERITAFVDATR